MGTAHITFSMQIAGEYMFYPTTELDISSESAKEFGYPAGKQGADKPTVLDALIEAHRRHYGASFSPDNCRDYLVMTKTNWMTKAFGLGAVFAGFIINGKYAYELGSQYTSRGYRGLPFNEAVLSDGDIVEVFIFKDSEGMDYYLYFLGDDCRKGSLVHQVHQLNLAVGEEATLTLEGLLYGFGGAMKAEDRLRHKCVSRVKGAQLVTIDPETGAIAPMEGVLTDADGKATFSFAEPGTYFVSSLGGKCRYTSNLTKPWLRVDVG